MAKHSSHIIVTIFVPTNVNGLTSSGGDCIHGYHKQELYGRGQPQHTIVLSEGQVTEESTHKGSPTSLLGKISSDESASHLPEKAAHPIWMHVNTTSHKLITSLYINGEPIDLKCISLIFFDPTDMQESELLPLRYSSPEVDPISFLISSIRSHEQISQTTNYFREMIIFPLIYIVIRFLLLLIALPNSCSRLQYMFVKISGYKSASLGQISVRVEQLNEINHMLALVRKRQTNRSQTNCNLSAGAKWYSRFEGWLGLYKGNSSETGQRIPCLVLGRLVCVVFVDLLLGAMLLYYLNAALPVHVLVHSFGDTTQWVSSNVLHVLSWLRGAPAGLKLNQPLTRALANFFSYHVGLWTLYLEVAGGVVHALCSALVWSGLLGISVQVALLSDLLYFATLHLHCFYIYAARLHMVQVSLLGSQWRAFRGHKWNTLKERVDSMQPSRPLSRVLTAITFTLVVFLLPTTTVYYLVFLTLRLVLHASHGALVAFTWLVNHNPVFTVAMQLSQSSKIKGEITLERSQQWKGALLLNTRPSSLTHISEFSAPTAHTTIQPPDLHHLLLTILYARQLI